MNQAEVSKLVGHYLPSPGYSNDDRKQIVDLIYPGLSNALDKACNFDAELKFKRLGKGGGSSGRGKHGGSSSDAVHPVLVPYEPRIATMQEEDVDEGPAARTITRVAPEPPRLMLPVVPNADAAVAAVNGDVLDLAAMWKKDVPKQGAGGSESRDVGDNDGDDGDDIGSDHPVAHGRRRRGARNGGGGRGRVKAARVGGGPSGRNAGGGERPDDVRPDDVAWEAFTQREMAKYRMHRGK